MTELVSKDSILKMYTPMKHKYFLTIKPRANSVNKIYELMAYLDKRCAYYWIVRCTSPTGFIHFHGLLAFSDNCNTGLLKLALHRKVNRTMGHFLPLELVRDLDNIYEYILSDKNKASEHIVKDHLEPNQCGYVLNLNERRLVTDAGGEKVKRGGAPISRGEIGAPF